MASGPPVAVARARNGLGLFATRTLKGGTTILRIEGGLVHYEVLWQRQGSFAANCYRFGPDTYLDPGDGVARYVNHSCEPNAGIMKDRNRLFLFAAEQINRGSEITIDYSTTIGDDDIWRMRCNCGRPGCRRTIRNFGTLPLEVRSDYLARSMVPGFIRRTLIESLGSRRVSRVRRPNRIQGTTTRASTPATGTRGCREFG